MNLFVVAIDPALIPSAAGFVVASPYGCGKWRACVGSEADMIALRDKMRRAHPAPEGYSVQPLASFLAYLETVGESPYDRFRAHDAAARILDTLTTHLAA
ncbi:hypothetical protein phiCbK_310 [Caulobacter phage phiCbK]|uniref:Uncharacterized protein n=5 Tax=Viruses TaxID=10239 RepID=J3SL24_9CAUD|nr:hypothetical protein D865_gp009 [Caulobacter phage phiCbK]YP_006988223.1 hypothetical protein D865_gp091 [Caulobacter phage phiCbK]ARB14928.1 hypothetical protein Ccr32_gp009 [Caulobacter phage Ccr32]ARB15259.1 hypothetical protein Ccr34_gp010 [Caulobacter phage Ccr34]AFO71827.1 hypothetical protein phiCbK_310 [Caulobacter phage phiCbK]AFU86841.1 hypothetical protein CbK_gp009 [Caulobacter phage phiCbK]AFU87159.1 hypothetical protein CbK_gp327 [Caulobacter phage phiCbK]